MTIRNLTPHDVTILGNDRKIVFPKPGGDIRCPRVKYFVSSEYTESGIKMVDRKPEVVNLPEPEEGILFIVSHIVLQFTTDRSDLIAPYTFDCPRDDDNHVIGVHRFLRNWPPRKPVPDKNPLVDMYEVPGGNK